MIGFSLVFVHDGGVDGLVTRPPPSRDASTTQTWRWWWWWQAWYGNVTRSGVAGACCLSLGGLRTRRAARWWRWHDWSLWCGVQGPVESEHAIAMVIQRGLHRTLNKMFHASP